MISMIQTIGEPVIAILVLIGAVLSVLSAFGIIRFPDVYLRAHAATKSATLGVLCVLLGGFLFFWIFDGYPSMRILLGILFVFITAPVAGHLNARAAYRTGVPLWKLAKDELKPALKKKGIDREKAEKEPLN
ncbi:monovalent cation/H(+) antiporter subunit G [Paenibacillus wulumuqiensis]|uniref:monovalent cation/H(+) antiporter subunit G n=1 Tax=Paenibacillus wulumuqiensis TaxID=1567107 RepID=UPI0006199C2B|nr:monovalent cation/H(+) antiporter subunit G [Paenibacillus wulumuqiensis]